jgi:hypothetical protein
MMSEAAFNRLVDILNLQVDEIKSKNSTGGKGDSSLDHVPLQSPTVPRLAGKHQKTITLHSHLKRGVVVWSLGMRGNGILMHPGFLFCIMTGIDYISPTKETDNSIRKFKCVLIRSNYFDHTGGRRGTFVSPFRKR